MGDDIGYEVVPEAVKVLSAAAKIAKCEVEWSNFPIGKELPCATIMNNIISICFKGN